MKLTKNNLDVYWYRIAHEADGLTLHSIVGSIQCKLENIY